MSLRETLATVERMTGRTQPESINPEELPPVASHIWQWFLTLNGKRQSGMNGPCPISESEIGWFFRNRGITPMGWALDALDALDRVAMESAGNA